MIIPFSVRDPGGSGERYPGEIIVVKLEKEPYEAFVEFNGWSYQLVFGSQINGNFLCVPNFGYGCEMSEWSDRHWNEASMSQCGMDEDEVVIISSALCELDRYIRDGQN